MLLLFLNHSLQISFCLITAIERQLIMTKKLPVSTAELPGLDVVVVLFVEFELAVAIQLAK